MFILLLIICLLISTIPYQGRSASNNIWNTEWDFVQEITVPIDTSQLNARFQPIDQKIVFQHLCWGVDETSNSIRVICLHDGVYYELESQIYELSFSDESTISACNIVFLIPTFADGTESYYVYYDDTKKSDVSYPDHVSISESYYRYEPISGYPLESYFYKITDDESIPYTVSQEGQLMGYNTCQHVVKMLDNITEVLPKNGDLFAAFDFKYCYDNGIFDYSSTSQKLLSKEVFVDGNLMLSFGLVSTSKRDDLLTTVNYKYYHCPTSSNSRIRAHVIHEALTDVSSIQPASTDGVFASLQSGGVKSNSIKDLNIGEILPYLHFKNEFNEIYSYDIDTDPEYIPRDPDIRIASYKDDVDLGQQPWISFDEGEIGLAHGLLFHSNQVIVTGTDEKDGLQLNAFEMDYPHLPGLENNIATVQIGRNSYEPDSGHDINIPSDLVVEFDVEFFTSRTGGVNDVQREVEMYNLLIEDVSSTTNEYNNGGSSKGEHPIEVIITHAPSFPFGSLLSAVSGLNLSFITAELYRDGVYLSSETAVRIPMNALTQEATGFIDKIKSVFGIIDYSNISLRKKVVFSDMKPGNYTVKVFLENQFLKSDRQYIGFATVNHKSEDTTIRIKAGVQQTVSLTVKDQNGLSVEKAEVIIKKDAALVTSGMTDDQGMIDLYVPKNNNPYIITISLNDVECYQDKIDFSLFSRQIIEKDIIIERYNIMLELVDEWGLAPGIDIMPILLSSTGESLGTFEKRSDTTYQFLSLAPDQYQLIMKYKSVTLIKEINLNQDTSLSLTFPARFQTTINVLDDHGLRMNDIKFSIERGGIKEEISSDDGEVRFIVPPGKYMTRVTKDDTLIAQRNLMIIGDESYDYVSLYESLYPMLIIIIIFLSTLGIVYFLYVNHRLFDIITLIPIILVLASLVLPWWGIHGSYQSVETQTQLFFIPSNLITVTDAPDVLIGDQGYLPDLFFIMIDGIIGMMIAAIVLIILVYLLKKQDGDKHVLLSFVPIILLLGAIMVFIFGMSTLSMISVGTFLGSGPLDVSVSGQAQFQQIPSQWGPSIGFYVLVLSLLIYLIPFMIATKRIVVNRFE